MKYNPLFGFFHGNGNIPGDTSEAIFQSLQLHSMGKLNIIQTVCLLE